MASSLRSLAWAVLLGGACAGAASAQTAGPLALSGRAVRVAGDDTLPLAGAVVVAHHVSAEAQGPVDSVRADAAGRFRITVPRPDTGALYVVSTRYRDIGYFGVPVPARDRAQASGLLLVVFDTSSAGPPLAVVLRHLVLTRAEADGSRRVLDIFQVHNPTAATRVSGTGPTWTVRLPSGIADFTLGESDISPAAVRRDGDVVSVSAPFPPGDKQVLFTYVLPRGVRDLRIPVDQPVARIELLVEDVTSEASGAGVAAAEPISIEGRTFRRFAGERLSAGQTVDLRLSAGTDWARRYAWLVVVAAALALGAALVVLARRRRGVPAAAPAAAGPDVLAAQIAALDERFEGREAETPADEWARYTTRREELKARLRDALARGGPA